MCLRPVQVTKLSSNQYLRWPSCKMCIYREYISAGGLCAFLCVSVPRAAAPLVQLREKLHHVAQKSSRRKFFTKLKFAEAKKIDPKFT